MKIIALILISTFINNIAQAMEGVRATCVESAKHGNHKGTFPLPPAFLQPGDSLSLGSYIHIEDRYMITVIPPISQLTVNSAQLHETVSGETYEVLLTQLPDHEKHPNSPQKVCHAVSVLISGTQTKTLEYKYKKKDDVGGFMPHTTQVSCTLDIVNI